MQRVIIDFERDEESHWVARLDCGHGQHVRHRPPFVVRLWTQTAAGRKARIGTSLECLKCDRCEWPEDLEHYRSTPIFSAETVPRGLTRQHSTKAGVWGRVVVLAGELEFVADPPVSLTQTVAEGDAAIVVPGNEHYVRLGKDAQFRVDFYRPAKRLDAPSPGDGE